MTNYSGAGFSSDPAYTLQSDLITRWEQDAVPGATPSYNITAYYNTNIQPYTPSTISADFVGNYAALSSAQNKMPQTIDQFASGLAAYYVIPLSDVPAIKAILLAPFADLTGMSSPAIDGTALANVSSLIGVSSSQLTQDIQERAFNEFIQNFSYNTANPTAPVVPADFQTQLSNFLFNFATISSGIPLDPQSDPTYTGQNALNFKDVYNAFFPNNPTAFDQYLADYIKNLMYPAAGTSSATFLPSDQIGTWLQTVQQSYLKAISGTPTQTTSSVGESFKQVAILDRIFQLLVNMIGIIQQTASAQSDRLKILTQWQSAYTTLQTNIHVFTVQDGTFPGGNNDQSAGVRNDLNNLNQTYTENIRSRRSVVQDEAKSLQSNLNQSSDAANNQGNIATSILQQLTTLLGAIYR